MAFKAPYVFDDERQVVIEHPCGKFLQLDPGNNSVADPNGTEDGSASYFIVELVGGDSKCKLKSKQTGKYLRIEPNAKMNAENKIDIGGAGGKWTVFKVHKQASPGTVKLESAEQPGMYIAVQKDGVMRIGAGGPWTVMKFRCKGDHDAVKPFTWPYDFAKANTVVIQHKGGGHFDKFLRVDPESQHLTNHAGGKGKFAQFEADPQDGGSNVRFKSIKTGKYLQIAVNGDISRVDVDGRGGNVCVFKVAKQGDGTIKLESNVFAGKYVAVDENNVVRTGGGGPWCAVKIFGK